MKVCPYCAEDIKDAAIVCRYCGRDLVKNSKKVIKKCPYCAKEIENDYCSSCGRYSGKNLVNENKNTATKNIKVSVNPSNMKKKSPWLGVFLNWIFGIGYIYAGDWVRFFFALAIFMGLSAILEIMGFSSQIRTAAVGLAVLISMVDVYYLIKKYNEQLNSL